MIVDSFEHICGALWVQVQGEADHVHFVCVKRGGGEALQLIHHNLEAIETVAAWLKHNPDVRP